MLLTHRVEHEDSGHKAVDVLCRRTGMSRLMAKRIRLHGKLTCNGRFHRMIDPVQAGDLLVAELPSHSDKRHSLRPLSQAPLIYQDDWLIVVAKPTQMVIHPTYLHHTGSLTDLLSDLPLHPVTRLDRDTSGAVLIAMNGHAHHVLSSGFMAKRYIGLVHGKMRARWGLIQAPISRHPQSIMLRQVKPDGARALTRWECLRYFAKDDVSLLRFQLLTGRTHQIRVHCQALGHPLLGDGLYGIAETEQAGILDRQIGRQALHAAQIEFEHPVSRQHLRLTAPLPEDMRQLLRQLDQRSRVSD